MSVMSNIQYSNDQLREMLYSNDWNINNSYAEKVINHEQMCSEKMTVFLASQGIEDWHWFQDSPSRLSVDYTLWEQKIKPVTEFYQAYETELSKCRTAEEFERKFSSLNIQLPKKEFLRDDMQLFLLTLALTCKKQSSFTNFIGEAGLLDTIDSNSVLPKKTPYLDNPTRFDIWYGFETWDSLP